MSSLAKLIGGAVGWSRERKAQLTDEGQNRIVLDPNQMEVETLEMPSSGTFVQEIDSVNEAPLNLIVLDERNLTYLQAGQADFAPIYESGMTTDERMEVELPEGEWYLIYYNEDQRNQAIVFLEWELDCTSALGV